jgi:hypothetical protein
VTHEPETVGGVIRWMLHHPWRAIGSRWNYKSAVLSAACRAILFFSTNLSAGLDAALGALAAEFALRLTTAGFYGAVTQAFRRARPECTAMFVAMVVLPTVSHSLEWLVHWLRGTPELLVSMAVSIAFTALSTSFNLFAMRRGVLVVGTDGRKLLDDLRAMPRLVGLFVAAAARSCARALP